MVATYEQVSGWLDALLQTQDEVRATAPEQTVLLQFLALATDRLDDMRRDFPEHATSEGNGDPSEPGHPDNPRSEYDDARRCCCGNGIPYCPVHGKRF